MSAQSYAGLLERLGKPLPTFGNTDFIDTAAINRNQREAREAISSLLKALEFYAEQWEQDVDAERTLSGWEGTIGEVLPTRALLDDFGQRARAALNSDAPLSKDHSIAVDDVRVPREPTPEMLMAGRKQTFADMTGEHCGPSAENTWKAMYDAAITAIGSQSTGGAAE